MDTISGNLLLQFAAYNVYEWEGDVYVHVYIFISSHSVQPLHLFLTAISEIHTHTKCTYYYNTEYLHQCNT